VQDGDPTGIHGKPAKRGKEQVYPEQFTTSIYSKVLKDSLMGQKSKIL
jgi:hypothetical protein